MYHEQKSVYILYHFSCSHSSCIVSCGCTRNIASTAFIDTLVKWFIFWGVGVRLLTAGLMQVMKPNFTSEGILKDNHPGTLILARELGLANICFGIIGIVSLFVPQWRMATVFSGGVYIGIAGIQHISQVFIPTGRHINSNEIVAMVSDLFILLVLIVCVFYTI